jgi:uncharacterized protein
MTDRLLQPQSGRLPHGSSPTSAPFWDGCAAGELRYQRCEHCGEANFPPADHCRFCLSAALDWAVGCGTGEIYSWTVVYRPVTTAFEPPYAPAIVTLREGYQLLTNIIGVPIEDLRVGLPVQVLFCAVDDGVVLPYFTRAEPHGQ